MLRFLWLMMFLLALGGGSQAAEQVRVALVIGNGAYIHGDRLANPVNDAKDMARALARLGFAVHRGFDLPRTEMQKLIRTYAKAARGADLALVFYAGHGVQAAGENYLLPIDAAPKTVDELDVYGVRTDYLLRRLNRNIRYRIVMLDACRDNPFPQALTSGDGDPQSNRQATAARPGLAEMSAPQGGNGSLIVFATDPGNVAFDGAEGNSPFTGALLRHIETPGASVLTMLTRVNRDVAAQTSGRQRPWMSASLTGDVFLAPEEALPRNLAKASGEAAEPGASGGGQTGFVIERDIFRAAQSTGYLEDYRAYLDAYPKGHYARIARNAVVRLKSRPELSIAHRLSAATTALVAAPPSTNRAALETLIASDLTEAALQLSWVQQRGIQRRLALVGFDTGNADGVHGPATRRAISLWQADNSFFNSGYLNQPQYDELLQQSDRKYAKWIADRRQKLAMTRSLASKHAGRGGFSSSVRKFKAFLTRTFPVTRTPGPGAADTAQVDR